MVAQNSAGTSLATLVINAVRTSTLAYCKFLSANDAGATGGHQAGVLIGRKSWPICFGDQPVSETTAKRSVEIHWQGDERTTNSTFTWYPSKRELRLTGFGKGFPFLKPDETGALFVLCQIEDTTYTAFVLDGDSMVDEFLDEFGLGPQDTNAIINIRKPVLSDEARENAAIEAYVRTLGLMPDTQFPKSGEVSAEARRIHDEVHDHVEQLITNPDSKIVGYTQVEYAIFRAMENAAFGPRVREGFSTLDDFVMLALSLLLSLIHI